MAAETGTGPYAASPASSEEDSPVVHVEAEKDDDSWQKRHTYSSKGSLRRTTWTVEVRNIPTPMFAAPFLVLSSDNHFWTRLNFPPGYCTALICFGTQCAMILSHCGHGRELLGIDERFWTRRVQQCG
eukprot:scaffold73265_cov46-Prasinocladus_malaysianus.AAC.1